MDAICERGSKHNFVLGDTFEINSFARSVDSSCVEVARNSHFVTGILDDSSIDKSTEETILAHTQDTFGDSQSKNLSLTPPVS